MFASKSSSRAVYSHEGRRAQNHFPHQHSVLHFDGDRVAALPQLVQDLVGHRQHRDAHVPPRRLRLEVLAALLLLACNEPVSIYHRTLGYWSIITFREKVFDVVDGNGEADAGGDFHAVHADGLAVEVDERPAGVAERDGRVGLDVVYVSACERVF